jgi:hypothetical protein
LTPRTERRRALTILINVPGSIFSPTYYFGDAGGTSTKIYY